MRRMPSSREELREATAPWKKTHNAFSRSAWNWDFTGSWNMFEWEEVKSMLMVTRKLPWALSPGYLHITRQIKCIIPWPCLYPTLQSENCFCRETEEKGSYCCLKRTLGSQEGEGTCCKTGKAWVSSSKNPDRYWEVKNSLCSCK